MVSILRRALFWRVYLTLLGSLLLVSLLATALWHWFAAPAMQRATDIPTAMISALMPPPGAPPAQLDGAAGRLASALGEGVAVTDRTGRVFTVTEGGRGVQFASQTRPGADASPRRLFRLARRIRLPDGRALWIERSMAGADPGPHILGMLLAISAAVGLAAFPIVSRLTLRLERLRSSLDAWGAGALDRRADVEGADEIAAVAASFNAAADRVEALLAAHRALLAHARHELRSPLTRLRVAVELLADAPTPELRASIIADISELDGLVEEILLASRLDHSPIQLERESVDCLVLAIEEGARAGVGVRYAEGVTFEIEGSSRLLRRLIRNLIENAIRHGAPPVEIELGHAGAAPDGAVTIAVDDHGPGIPEADRERVFQPFYRPAGHTEAAGGWGLGLSIVRQIAELHGGTVACLPRSQGGFTFVATLPVSAAADH